MASYLVEFFLSRGDITAVEIRAARLRRAAEELTSQGMPVRCRLSLFVPEDETCFLPCDAASTEAVHEVARRAALPFERIVEVVTNPS
jgi:hypothetical protein